MTLHLMDVFRFQMEVVRQPCNYSSYRSLDDDYFHLGIECHLVFVNMIFNIKMASFTLDCRRGAHVAEECVRSPCREHLCRFTY